MKRSERKCAFCETDEDLFSFEFWYICGDCAKRLWIRLNNEIKKYL